LQYKPQGVSDALSVREVERRVKGYWFADAWRNWWEKGLLPDRLLLCAHGDERLGLVGRPFAGRFRGEPPMDCYSSNDVIRKLRINTIILVGLCRIPVDKKARAFDRVDSGRHRGGCRRAILSSLRPSKAASIGGRSHWSGLEQILNFGRRKAPAGALSVLGSSPCIMGFFAPISGWPNGYRSGCTMGDRPDHISRSHRFPTFLRENPLRAEATMGNEVRGLADLDRVIHEPARLMVMLNLSTVESADFSSAKRDTTHKGNLSTHCETRGISLRKNREDVQGEIPSDPMQADSSGCKGDAKVS